MTSTASPTSTSVVFLLSLVVATAAAGWWRAHVFLTKPVHVAAPPADHAKEVYPLPPEPAKPQEISSETVEQVVRANPFSPERRHVPPSATAASATGEGGTIEPPVPKFAYKGRINMGNRQRAILEDTASHKTYFLEVGQEVAEFKVLDIAENRVVLSDPKTHEDVVVSLTSTRSP